MKSWKQLVACIAIVVILGSMVLMRVGYWPILRDAEYVAALERAEQYWFPGVETAMSYPFTGITRAEAVWLYVRLGQVLEMLPVRSSCEFFDIGTVSLKEQENIILSCQYWFFSWSNWSFEPLSYMTKWTSMVALMRWLFPAREFPEVEEFWLPYIEFWNEIGIITREPWPYVNYLISRYELLLQLYRAYQLKTL